MNLEEAAALKVEVSDAELDAVADMALQLMQRNTRRMGAILSHGQQLAYTERSDTEREGMRAAVVLVIKALAARGLIELPG